MKLQQFWFGFRSMLLSFTFCLAIIADLRTHGFTFDHPIWTIIGFVVAVVVSILCMLGQREETHPPERRRVNED